MTDHRRSIACLAARIVAIGVALTAITLATPPASAHSELLDSTPSDGQVVRELPDEVELTFNQDIAPDFATVTAAPLGSDAQGTRLEVAVDGPLITADVPTSLRSDADAGDWQVSYRVTSADGHPISGRVRFVVRAIPSPTSEDPTASTTPGDQTPPHPEAAEPPSDRDDTGSEWISTVVIGLIALVGTIGVMILLGRRSGRL